MSVVVETNKLVLVSVAGETQTHIVGPGNEVNVARIEAQTQLVPLSPQTTVLVTTPATIGITPAQGETHVTQLLTRVVINKGDVGGGSSTFIGLIDTPDAYSGQGEKSVVVKADETGLEFGDSAGGLKPIPIQANTGLQAGDFVAVISVLGIPRMTPAIASTPEYRAAGFVKTAVSIGQVADMHPLGSQNDGLGGLLITRDYFLSAVNAGKLAAAPPIGTNKIIQRLGLALSSNTLMTSHERIIVI